MRIGKHEISDGIVRIFEIEFTDIRLAQMLSELSDQEQIDFLTNMLKFSSQLAIQAHSRSEVRELESVLEKAGVLFETGTEDFKTEFLELLNNQLDESKHGSLVSLLRSKLVDALVKSLMPSNEDSPLHNIRNDLRDLLDQTIEQKGLRKGKSKSGSKGQEFEAQIHQLIAEESEFHGDTAEFTGDLPTASGEKAGDSVVRFTSTDFRVVWEAKTDSTFKSKAQNKQFLLHAPVRKELILAMTNREAQCAIFVADSLGLEQQPEWQILENDKLMIVINPESPDQRLIRLAYLWSKSVAARRQQVELKLDFNEIEDGLRDLDAAVASYKQIKAAHTKIETGLGEARGYVEAQETAIKRAVERIHFAVSPVEDENDNS